MTGVSLHEPPRRATEARVDELDAEDASLTRYKRMDLERLPDALNRVEWRQAVPVVSDELLSQFILAHPLPNVNHRTAIGLLDRYRGETHP